MIPESKAYVGLFVRTVCIGLWSCMLSACAVKGGYQQPLDGEASLAGFMLVEGEARFYSSSVVEPGLGITVQSTGLEHRRIMDLRTMARLVPFRGLVTPFLGGGYGYSSFNRTKGNTRTTDDCGYVGPVNPVGPNVLSCRRERVGSQIDSDWHPHWSVGARLGRGDYGLVVENRREFGKKLSGFDFSNNTVLVGVWFNPR